MTTQIQEQRTYTISVNADHIQKNAPEYAHLFTEEVKTRNGVVWPNKKGYTLTDRGGAQELYFKLYTMNVMVFRNWI